MSNKSEFNRFRKVVAGIPPAALGTMELILEQNAQEAATYAKQLAPIHDGHLRNNIRVQDEPSLTHGSMVAKSVVADTEYAPYVEFGTKSRANPSPEWNSYAREFQGKTGWRQGAYESIMAWGLKKGFERSHAFAIFLSIMRYGIHPHPFMYPAFKRQRRRLVADLKRINANLILSKAK